MLSVNDDRVRSQRARLLALICLAFVSTNDRAQAQSLPRIVDRYIAWRGGESFRHLTTTDETGIFADGGLRGPSRLVATQDGRLLEDLHFGPLSTVVIDEGDRGWSTNFSGQVTPLSSEERAYAAADARLLFAAALATPADLTLAPPEKFGGARVSAVRLQTPGGAVYTFLIARDGALRAIRTRCDGMTGLLSLTDWRTVHGVRLPFHLHKSGAVGLTSIDDDTTDFTIDTAKLNMTPAPAEFAAPLSRNVVTFASSRSTSGWIPFTLTDHLIFLPIKVNGHLVQAIFDSGAGITVLDNHYAASIGITGIGNFGILGQGGAAADTVATGVTVAAGGMTLKPITIALLDLGIPDVHMVPPLVAIVGAEAFDQAVVDIDYSGHRLRFLAPGTIQPPAGATVLPLIPFEGSFDVPVSVEGRPAVRVILDTGSDGSFSLFPAYWQADHLLAGRPSSVGRGGGVGGLVNYDEASLRTLGIGGITLHDVGTSFERPGDILVNQTVYVGNLGDAIISRFRVLIDVPARTIAFTPTAATSAPQVHDLVGLELAPGKTLEIVAVKPNSPAAAARLKAGETIAAIDGQQPGGLPLNWDTSGDGKTVTLTMSTGAIVRFVKRRYD